MFSAEELSSHSVGLVGDSPPPSPIAGLSSEAFGYLTVAIAIIAFGSFNIPLKVDRTKRADPDPMIFQIYINLAVFSTSFIVLGWTQLVLTPWGILSATLWVTASILSIFAIKNIGLAVSQGVWAGCTMIVSFIWGAVIFKETPNNTGLAVVGLGMLIIGIACMSVAGSDFLVPLRERTNVQQEFPTSGDTSVKYAPIESEEPQKSPLLGLACAIALAIPNGSMFAPAQYAKAEGVEGIDFLVSFGVGVLAITPLFAFVYFLYFRYSPSELFKPKILFLPGFMAGFGWNIGNAASIYALTYLGFGVGFPLSQCALLVGGMWGIVMFKEITGAKRILLFAFGSLVLIGGAVLLGEYGQQAKATPPSTNHTHSG